MFIKKHHLHRCCFCGRYSRNFAQNYQPETVLNNTLPVTANPIQKNDADAGTNNSLSESQNSANNISQREILHTEKQNIQETKESTPLCGKHNTENCDEQKNSCENHADRAGLFGRGLFFYKKWWELSEVDIFVNGEMISGIPIFSDKNTLRVVNGAYSYFVPMEKIDYIRTTDGLKPEI